MNVVHFRDAKALDRWFAKHHAKATELWIGFHRKGTGLPGVTYAEAVDAALCWGWIDGLKKKVDDTTYTHRFTPRKPDSIWSDINTKKVQALKAAGRMQPPGLAAFAKRDAKRAGVYSFERKTAVEFDPGSAREFRRHRAAWRFFEAQPPGWRRLMAFYVTSAKQPETRARRLAKLIAAASRGERLS